MATLKRNLKKLIKSKYLYNRIKRDHMKKFLALILLGVGFASQIEVSDNNYPDFPPCNLPEPSPPSTPRESDDKK